MYIAMLKHKAISLVTTFVLRRTIPFKSQIQTNCVWPEYVSNSSMNDKQYPRSPSEKVSEIEPEV